MKVRPLHAFDAALVAGCLVIASWWLPEAPERPARLIVPGVSLEIPGFEFARSERHIVLLLDVACPYSLQGVPFYKLVASRAAAREDVDFVVLSSDPPNAVREWLATNEIAPARKVRIINPSRSGFSVVPTLLIVSPEGTVTDVAQGLLSQKERDTFLARVDLVAPTALNNARNAHEIDAAGLDALMALPPVQLIDLRERADFSRGHRRGAINIPFEEIGVRSKVELSLQTTTVIDCAASELVPVCREVALGLTAFGFREVYALMDFDRRRWWLW